MQLNCVPGAAASKKIASMVKVPTNIIVASISGTSSGLGIIAQGVGNGSHSSDRAFLSLASTRKAASTASPR